jgi:hypothetical protein
MALCHFCGRVDFKNGQAVRAHLRACEPYQDRADNDELYQIVLNMGGSPQEADQARRGGRPRRALCHFCGRADFKNGQAVRAHLQACQAYRTRRRKRRLRAQ